MAYPITTTKFPYQSIVNYMDSGPIPVSTEDVDDVVVSVQIIDSTLAMYFLDIVLPYEQEILEEMIVVERPRNDFHHCSYFLPDFPKFDSSFPSPLSQGSVHKILNPLAPTHILAEGNMANISKTISMNI